MDTDTGRVRIVLGGEVGVRRRTRVEAGEESTRRKGEWRVDAWRHAYDRSLGLGTGEGGESGGGGEGRAGVRGRLKAAEEEYRSSLKEGKRGNMATPQHEHLPFCLTSILTPSEVSPCSKDA